MKQSIVLILFLLQLSCKKPLRDSVTLDIQFKPETTYSYTSKQILQSVINYTGKKESLQELKNRGIQNPGITNKTLSVEANLKTGPLDDESYFPLKVEYVRTLNNNGKEELPINATIIGKCQIEKQPAFDVIMAEDLDKKHKIALLEAWQNAFSQLTFSGEKVRIGEKITTESPYSIPMEGSEIEMVIQTNYKLVSIKDDIAGFAISQKYTLTPRLMDNSFEAIVNGEGYMVYDMSKRIALDYTLKTEMKLHKNLDSFSFELTTKSELVQRMNVLPK